MSIIICLTAWPKDQVLGLSSDDGLIGFVGQRPIFVKAYVCRDRFRSYLFCSVMSPCSFS